MVANSHDRSTLIEQLAWQHAMGIDEILLDIPAPEQSVAMSALLSPVPSPAIPAVSTDHSPGTPTAGQVPVADRPVSAPPSAPQVAPTAQSPDQSATLAGITDLDALRAALEMLDGCALRHTASNMIFADGNPGARLMVIGDVPGRDEDRVGLPLVGADGQLFDRMLSSIGLSRADIYLVPLIPWRPPGNRTPTAEEMALLLPWLYRHVQLAAPERLLLLGGVTAKAVLPPAGGILKLRGRWHDIDYGDGRPRPTLATLHPAYLSRSPAQKRLAFADLVALAGKLG
ncbi:uracil-DNA glycosylase family protein [Alphaproteobacteria bacterium LSUCC0719]